MPHQPIRVHLDYEHSQVDLELGDHPAVKDMFQTGSTRLDFRAFEIHDAESSVSVFISPSQAGKIAVAATYMEVDGGAQVFTVTDTDVEVSKALSAQLNKWLIPGA